MKAEQRKELETNTLADKMGRVVQRVKESPRRNVTGYVVAAIAVVVVLFLGYRWWATRQIDISSQWVAIYEGGQVHLKEVDPQSNAGKAARLQQAYLLCWDKGIKKLGLDANDALRSLFEARQIYDQLATDCKDDVIFEPQALLGKAIVEETLAVQNTQHLDKAKELYDDVVKKYEKSSEGKLAKERYNELADAKKQKLVANDYERLASLLDPARRVLGKDLNKAPVAPFHDNLPKPKPE